MADAFQWGDYIRLDMGDPSFAVLVRASLDQISLTPEGRDIVQRGYENIQRNRRSVDNQGPQKIEINDHDLMNDIVGSNALPVLGKIGLQRAQIGSIGFPKQDGSMQPMGLTHILVHELFHQADPNLQMQSQQFWNNTQAGFDAMTAPVRLTSSSGERLAAFKQE